MNIKEHWFPSHIMEIDTDECLELASSRSVGRVAYSDQDGPVALPVNYVLDGGDVLFRISAHSSLAQHLRSGPASFEIDEIDDYTQSGWSVLIRGTARFIEYDQLPEPSEATRSVGRGQPDLPRTNHPQLHHRPSAVAGLSTKDVSKMLVREVMTSPALTVHTQTPIDEAISLLDQHAITMVPVVSGAGVLVGVLSEADVVRDALPPDARTHLIPAGELPVPGCPRRG